MTDRSGNYGLLEDTPLRLVKGAVKNFTIYSYDVDLDELGSEVESARARSDLAGAVLTYNVWDAAGSPVLTKTSASAAQIEIAADQTVNSPTRGTATLKFLAVDTMTTLTAGTEYWHALRCLYPDGRDDRIIKKSRLYVVS